MNLRLKADADLAREYAAAARRRGDALGISDSDRANREFDELTAVYRELKRRGPSAFDALLELSRDPDPNVRGAVGWALIEQSPETARAILEEVAKQPGLAGFSADMTLKEWEKGTLEFPAAAK